MPLHNQPPNANAHSDAIDAWTLARLNAPLPDPDIRELSTKNPPDPVAVTKMLKWLSDEILMLFVYAKNNDFIRFLQKYESASQSVRLLAPKVQQLRHTWALACRKDLSMDIELHGRKCSSGHLCLYEWCREVLFLVWGATDLEGLTAALGGKSLEIEMVDVRSNWHSVRKSLDKADYVNPRDCHPQLEAELGAIIGGTTGNSHFLPVVHNDPIRPRVEYPMGTFSYVTPDQASALSAILAGYPYPVGLTKIIGPRPNRKLKSLPPELSAIITSGVDNKGYRLTI